MTHTKIFNTELEQTVLGMIILENKYMNIASNFITENDFYNIEHQIIYKHLNSLYVDDIIFNSVTLKSFFNNEPSLEKQGGEKYISFITTLAISFVDIKDMVLMIKDYAEKRKLREIGENLILNVESHYDIKTSKELVEEAENNINDIISGIDRTKGFKSVNNSFDCLIEEIEYTKENGRNKEVILTGYKKLDNFINGFKPSNLIVIGAKSGMGKSAFALNLALNIAKNFRDNQINKSVGFFSLEMSENEVNSRILSIETGINGYNFSNGNLNDFDMLLIKEKKEEIKQMPLFIDDTSGLSLSTLRVRAKRLKEKKNLSILFIDYLQIMSSKHDSEYAKITELTRELKILAGELNIPIVVLSQLSRASDSREDKRPILSDLRASGSVEQDSNIVIFLHREDYYRKDFKDLNEINNEIKKPVEIGKTGIMVAKNRSGKITTVYLQYVAKSTKFVEYKSI